MPRFATVATAVVATVLLAGVAAVSPAHAQVNFGDLATGGCDPDASPQCGGHGTCDNATRLCSCEENWSVLTDFMDFQDCATSVIAMYILWALSIVEIAWVLYSSTFILVARFENFFQQRRTKKDYTLWRNKGLIAVSVYFSVCMPAHLTMAIYHMVYPLTRVGFDIAPTVLFFFGKLGLYVSSIFVQGPLISTALKGYKEFRGLVRYNYMLNTAISCVSIFVGCFGFITYDHFQTNRAKQVEIMRANYFLQACALIINGVQAYFVKKYVFHALDRAANAMSSADKTNSIKRKIATFQNTIIKQGIIQGAVYIIMGSVPFLLNKHQYFLPLSWLAMPILGKNLAFQFDSDKAGVKTMAERLGIRKTSEFTGSSTVRGGGKHTKGSHNPEGGTSLVMQTGALDSQNPQSMIIGDSPSSPTGKAQQKKDKKRHPKTGQVMSVALSDEDGMAEVLNDENKELRDKFTAFVRKRFATEAILFYDSCVRFQNAAQNARRASVSNKPLDAKHVVLNGIGHTIVQEHVAENAPHPVDMPDGMRKELLAMDAANNFPPDAFDKAKNMAFDLLKSNFYQQFAVALNDNTL